MCRLSKEDRVDIYKALIAGSSPQELKQYFKDVGLNQLHQFAKRVEELKGASKVSVSSKELKRINYNSFYLSDAYVSELIQEQLGVAN